MNLRIIARRMIIGLPLLLPTYFLNLVVVYILNIQFHLTSIGVISTVIVGDGIAYLGNVMLVPFFLTYYKRLGFFTEKDLERLTK